MTDLITKLEQAPEGNRELDLEIAGLKEVGIAILMDEDRTHTGPRYTTSIDAALTLVPEGLSWMITGGPVYANASVYDNMRTADPTGKHPPKDLCGRSTPVNAALALCIAALKALLALRVKRSDPAGSARK